MFRLIPRIISLYLCILFLLLTTTALASSDSLPSWNNSASKSSITAFVMAVTDKSSLDYVQPSERIAVFDNDGCLCLEQPAYFFQLFFAMDMVKELAADYPEWKTQQPFQAVLEGDMTTLAASGEKGLVETGF